MAISGAMSELEVDPDLVLFFGTFLFYTLRIPRRTTLGFHVVQRGACVRFDLLGTTDQALAYLIGFLPASRGAHTFLHSNVDDILGVPK